MKHSVVLIFALFLIHLNLHAQEHSPDLLQLVDWMSGEFSSLEQAAQDTSYYDISLKMTRIWPDKPNGVWLYVEQSVSETPDQPYRQRVYFLRDIGDGEFSSDVYELPDPEKYIGAWETPEVFDSITPFVLKYREGCAVFLFYDGFQYSGKTNNNTCESNLNGAAYATSEVIITPSTLKSWDRGYSEDGKQVWGAKKGPYIFKKE